MVGLLLFNQSSLPAQDWERVVDLRGTWKFSPGDNPERAELNFDDHEWDDIFVPAAWEDEGFPGYDGYGWYRKHFRLDMVEDEKNLYVNLGTIDDVDEVYFNGYFIGFSGSFPPDYFTAYNVERVYRLPVEYFRISGENVLSVRVFDEQQAGGIVRGRVGIYKNKNDLDLLLTLEGSWKFALRDDLDRKRIEYDDSNWKAVMVPAAWETQGFRNYDGFAWYRKKFIIPERLRGEYLVLILGKIDDIDEVYLNGRLIGKTGSFKDISWKTPSTEWLEIRAYEIEPEDIRYGETNTLAVRVYDGLVQGGIYEGPIGIARYQDYKAWSRKIKNPNKSLFDMIFK